MRNSRQPRCTAAKPFVLAVTTPKLLDASRNFGWVIFWRIVDGLDGPTVQALGMVTG
jgi:hypothetical protein